MIKLPILITTQQTLVDGTVQDTVVTDTLYVSSVRIDFNTGALYATVQRGTVVNGVFTSNFATLNIVVNPDGSFVSDGAFSGTPGTVSVSALVQSLSAQFDGMLNGVLATYQAQGVK